MGTYKWRKTIDGDDLLIVEVDGYSWNYGSMVLDSLKRHVNNCSKESLKNFLELEKQHFSNIEMRDLTEEFKILQKVPEIQELLNS